MTQKYHGAQFSPAKVILKKTPAPLMAHREMPSNAQEKAGICLSAASCPAPSYCDKQQRQDFTERVILHSNLRARGKND